MTLPDLPDWLWMTTIHLSDGVSIAFPLTPILLLILALLFKRFIGDPITRKLRILERRQYVKFMQEHYPEIAERENIK